MHTPRGTDLRDERLVCSLVDAIWKWGCRVINTYTEFGAYDAESLLPEFLRKATKSRMAFRITNRSDHVADLVPPGPLERRGGAQAAERMRGLVRTQPPIAGIAVKALIAGGRD